MKDLREIFARTEIEVSPPLVYFKETVSGVAPPESVLTNLLQEESATVMLVSNDDKRNRWYSKHCKLVEEVTSNGVVKLRVCAFPLYKSLAEALERSSNAIRSLFLTSSSIADWFQQSVRKSTQQVAKQDETSIDEARKLIQRAIGEIAAFEGEQVANQWRRLLSRAWSLGPRRVGPNILLGPPSEEDDWFSLDSSHLPDGATALQYLLDTHHSPVEKRRNGKEQQDSWETRLAVELHNSIVSGFQVATSSGPLCEEPMYGVCFSIEQIIVDWERLESMQTDPYGPLSGQVLYSSLLDWI